MVLQTENTLDRYLLCAGHGQAGWEHQKKGPVLSDQSGERSAAAALGQRVLVSLFPRNPPLLFSSRNGSFALQIPLLAFSIFLIVPC